jgi:hypothetical protein
MPTVLFTQGKRDRPVRFEERTRLAMNAIVKPGGSFWPATEDGAREVAKP